MHILLFKHRNEVVHELKDYPLPEDPMEPLLDLFLSNAEGLFGAASSSEGLDGGSTPVPSGEGLSQPWSERTLTGSASGRCSALSWVADEAVSLSTASLHTMCDVHDSP